MRPHEQRKNVEPWTASHPDWWRWRDPYFWVVQWIPYRCLYVQVLVTAHFITKSAYKPPFLNLTSAVSWRNPPIVHQKQAESGPLTHRIHGTGIFTYMYSIIKINHISNVIGTCSSPMDLKRKIAMISPHVSCVFSQYYTQVIERCTSMGLTFFRGPHPDFGSSHHFPYDC